MWPPLLRTTILRSASTPSKLDHDPQLGRQTGKEDFYKACDKYGILVFDDFWLANPSDGPNPNDEDMFMKNAVDKIKRVRRYASVCFYCGRNEGNPPETLNKNLEEATLTYDGTRHYIPHSASGTVSGYGPYAVQDPVYYFNNAPITLHSERGMPNIPAYESMVAMLGEDHLWPIDTSGAFMTSPLVRLKTETSSSRR